jgi:hypothetical protein
LHWILLPTKKPQQNAALLYSRVFKHGSHFDYWNQLLNMRMRELYLDCHEVELCCPNYWYTQKTYYVHYRCFTSICDLFTDSPS